MTQNGELCAKMTIFKYFIKKLDKNHLTSYWGGGQNSYRLLKLRKKMLKSLIYEQYSYILIYEINYYFIANITNDMSRSYNMNRKFKLFFSLASLCLSVAMLCFGVYSAMSVNYSVSGTVSYEVTDVFAKIDLSVYRSMSTAPIGSADNSANASKIQSAEDITSLGFKKLDDFYDSVSSYDPQTGKVESPGQDWTAESYDGLNFIYGTPGEQDSSAYAFYIVLDITNYGSETINATVTNNTESTTANTRFAQTDDVEIEASKGEPYSTNRIVLGLALEDATQSISDAMGDFSYTVNVQRGNLEYQVINDMTFLFDDINKTAGLGMYTGSANEVEIPSSVSNIIIEPKEAYLSDGWGVTDISFLASDMEKYISIALPSTISFEDGSTIKSLMPIDDIMAYEGMPMTITPLYVENGGSYTINEEFFGENDLLFHQALTNFCIQFNLFCWVLLPRLHTK